VCLSDLGGDAQATDKRANKLGSIMAFEETKLSAESLTCESID